MEYVVEMQLGAMLYEPSLKNWFRHSKYNRGEGGFVDTQDTKMHRHTDNMEFT
jgi:hypothetical protein